MVKCNGFDIFFSQAIELMVVDALSIANGYLQIADKIDKPDEFWKVFSTYID